jgi:hypothetical protein
MTWVTMYIKLPHQKFPVWWQWMQGQFVLWNHLKYCLPPTSTALNSLNSQTFRYPFLGDSLIVACAASLEWVLFSQMFCCYVDTKIGFVFFLIVSTQLLFLDFGKIHKFFYVTKLKREPWVGWVAMSEKQLEKICSVIGSHLWSWISLLEKRRDLTEWV